MSGGRWIWAVVLFTDDWLASQNHQIHLPTVTFITVIFKVTATCLVSQHWPPHIYSHLLSPVSLHPSSSLILSPGIWSATLLLFLHPPLPLKISSSFNYFYLTFFLSVSLSKAPPPRWRFTYSPTLLGRLRGSRVREVWRETGGKEENKTPSSSIVWRVCSESLYRSLSRDGEKFVSHSSPRCLTLEEEFSIPEHKMNVNETVSSWTVLVTAAFTWRRFQKQTGWH